MDFRTYEHTQFDKMMSELIADDLYKLNRPVDISDAEAVKCMLSCAFRNGIAYGRMITKEESEERLKKYGFIIKG